MNPYFIDNNSDPDQAEKIMKAQINSFEILAKKLANGTIREFAPPFESYDAFSGDIREYLTDFFARYEQLVAQLDCIPEVNTMLTNYFRTARNKLDLQPIDVIPVDLVNDLHSVCTMIINALVEYFNGFPDEAYTIISNALTADGFHLLNIIPQIQLRNNPLFRALKGHRSEPKDLFHLPFHLREKCQSYRFSIAGSPSFYCAATLETCMKEGRMINGEEVSATIFKYADDNEFYSFVDLSLPGRDLSFWEQYSLVVFYPLIVACALKVRKPDCYFKPEYVIPQLLYQAVRAHTTDIAGISYTSTRFSKPDLKDFRQRNFVIFVRNCDQASGYKKDLADQLKVVKPLTFNYSETKIGDFQKELLNRKFIPLSIN